MHSKPFAITHRQLAHRLASAWLSRHWFAISLPLAATAVWAGTDVRAVYVLLIELFIIYPSALSLVWFKHALSPHSIREVSLKTATISPTELHFEFVAADGHPTLPSFSTPWHEVSSVVATTSGLLLVTGPTPDCRITLLSEAFSPKQWQQIQENLSQKLPHDAL